MNILSTIWTETSAYGRYRGSTKSASDVLSKFRGVYRLRMLEPFYRWWIRKSPDVQNAIIPICTSNLHQVLSFIFGGVIYNGANFIIEREEAIMEKARVDPSFTEENLK